MAELGRRSERPRRTAQEWKCCKPAAPGPAVSAAPSPSVWCMGFELVARIKAIAGASILIAASLAVAAAPPSQAAPRCRPYCDSFTTRVANRIDGRGHGAWLATVLDQYGYDGRRWAEITRIPRGHGTRAVGVIHVPDGRAADARAALDGFYFAQRGTVFVLPLASDTNTSGGTGERFGQAARFAVRKLGEGWNLRTP